jgi:DNA-binding beta-propeller fold protein YncE
MHIFPQLRKAERKYARELAVVGVHAAKFNREKLSESIRDAAERYGLEHPIVNDRDFRVWQSYAVRAWPTMVFVDPAGRVIGQHSGELPFEALDQVLGQMVEEFDRMGLLDRSPLPFGVQTPEIQSALAFPGKVLADEPSGRLFIADSNHHRIVVADLDGTVQAVVGSGEAGHADGAYSEAQFNWPQGMMLVGDHLYVADTENHTIRRIDLAARRVETIAGTGQQARGYMAAGPGRETPLNSPWDLVALGNALFIAMAGSHQVWAMDLTDFSVRPHAGDGHEGIQDGPLETAWLAQPCGITTDGHRLYIADSESSAVRAVDVAIGGRVSTIVGTDLFAFGDKDGVGDDVLLQHPLGVLFHDGVLYVADTYNNRLKRCGVATRTVASWAGSGARGHLDGPLDAAMFDEPSGLTVVRRRIYVADTNNHAIRVVDLAAGEVSTLELQGLNAAC